jgi:hypothetical protein
VCGHGRQRYACSVCHPEGAFRVYKRGALRRGLAFDITLEDFKGLVALSCLYCGDDIAPRGVDRWDNKIGYTFENSRPCCGPCNRMKCTMSSREFVDRCKRISSRVQLVGITPGDIFLPQNPETQTAVAA